MLTFRNICGSNQSMQISSRYTWYCTPVPWQWTAFWWVIRISRAKLVPGDITQVGRCGLSTEMQHSTNRKPKELVIALRKAFNSLQFTAPTLPLHLHSYEAMKWLVKWLLCSKQLQQSEDHSYHTLYPGSGSHVQGLCKRLDDVVKQVSHRISANLRKWFQVQLVDTAGGPSGSAALWKACLLIST